MTYSNEQFDQLLEEHVDGERIDPVFQSALIDSLEHTMQKKTRFWARPVVPAAIVGVLLVGVITTAAFTDTFSNGSPTEVAEVEFPDVMTLDSQPPEIDDEVSATSWYIANDWTQEHVRFFAASSLTLGDDVRKEFGTVDEILEDLNWNPPFPIIADFPDDVYIDYDIVDHRVREDGMLEVRAVVREPKKTQRALGLDSWSGQQDTWVRVFPLQERKEERGYIESYKEYQQLP